MSSPSEILQLKQLLWSCINNSTQREEAISTVLSQLNAIAQGVATPLLTALVLLALAIVIYRPRIPRGALWVPAFGLFGGTPKFYTHTRPASVFGFFLHTRHRVTTHRRRKR